MYVCMYVRTYVCMYACMYSPNDKKYTYRSLHTNGNTYMYIYLYYTHIYVCGWICALNGLPHVGNMFVITTEWLACIHPSIAPRHCLETIWIHIPFPAFGLQTKGSGTGSQGSPAHPHQCSGPYWAAVPSPGSRRRTPAGCGTGLRGCNCFHVQASNNSQQTFGIKDNHLQVPWLRGWMLSRELQALVW